MKEFLKKASALLRNRWVRFAFWSLVYVLWFVVWTRQPWFLLGLVLIYDLFISRIFYRKVWQKHKAVAARNGVYREIAGWVEAIVFALVVATVVHYYVFQMYKIPTSSMEKTLLVGDYLYVSKTAFGPRMPMTPLTVPLVHHTMPFSKTKKSFSEAVKWEYHRLKGQGEVERNDIVVFNFPAGDTVLVENQAVTYYDVLHDYQSVYGPEEGRRKLNEDYTVISRPVDMREHYVKRCVALPGDTIAIRSSQVYINGEKQIEIPGREYVYFVHTDGTPLTRAVFEKLGIANDDIQYDPNSAVYLLPLTDDMVKTLQGMKNVTSVIKYESEGTYHAIFPNDDSYSWNEDNFGPLWVPSAGTTVALTIENLPLYRRIITAYEGHDLEVRDGKIFIDGEVSDSYTFAMDYYFMMGDNRHNSADSRFWGFVPENHIVGRPSFVWLSLDKDKKFPQNIRWNRMFRSVK
ncbi:MAG: signal peptidase I [Tidjanibacter sp.]|nr:signal peptidase I [Tidjanibacter sp.]